MQRQGGVQGMMECFGVASAIMQRSAMSDPTVTVTAVLKHGTPSRLSAFQIYKTSILVFKDRDRYVTGDYRFRAGYCRSNPRKMVKVMRGAAGQGEGLLRGAREQRGGNPSSFYSLSPSPTSSISLFYAISPS
jgi:hypothetical protein